MEHPQWAIDAVVWELEAAEVEHDDMPQLADRLLTGIEVARQAQFAEAMRKIFEPFVEVVRSIGDWLDEHPEMKDIIERLQAEDEEDHNDPQPPGG